MDFIYNDFIKRLVPELAKAKKVVVSLSGGLDSTILLYFLVDYYGVENVTAVSFDYHQRHSVELYQAKRTCKRLGVNHQILDIGFYGALASATSSMVVGSVPTPTMKDVLGDPQPSTYMPNRNMVLLSLTAAVAEISGADGIALGIQKIDSYSYWDTTQEFYKSMQNTLSLNRKNPITFLAPWVGLTKVEELKIAQFLRVPLEDTWTCYNPTHTTGHFPIYPVQKHGQSRYTPCGVCPSCSERAHAFKVAGMVDPIIGGVICVE